MLVTLVDDYDEFRFLLARLLKTELRVECLSLKSLADVLNHSDDVLNSKVTIIDINLGPGEPDGVAVYDWLVTKAYQGRSFFLTGHAKNSPEVQRAAMTGIEVLEKPMSVNDVLGLVRGIIKNPEMRIDVRN